MPNFFFEESILNPKFNLRRWTFGAALAQRACVADTRQAQAGVDQVPYTRACVVPDGPIQRFARLKLETSVASAVATVAAFSWPFHTGHNEDELCPCDQSSLLFYPDYVGLIGSRQAHKYRTSNRRIASVVDPERVFRGVSFTKLVSRHRAVPPEEVAVSNLC